MLFSINVLPISVIIELRKIYEDFAQKYSNMGKTFF